MKKIEAKIYGSTGWIITSADNEVMGFVWQPINSIFSFRYETFGTYSESGFGMTLEECLRYIQDAKT